MRDVHRPIRIEIILTRIPEPPGALELCPPPQEKSQMMKFFIEFAVIFVAVLTGIKLHRWWERRNRL